MNFATKTRRVGLCGLGNVIRAFINHYQQVSDFIASAYGFRLEFAAACDSRSFIDTSDIDVDEFVKKKEEGGELPLSDRPLEEMSAMIKAGRIDLLIDGLPSSKKDEGPSFPVVMTALEHGVSVICANKAPVVFKGLEMLECGRAHEASIGLSGATAGCLPAVGVMMRELAGSSIERIRGVLNGTSNFVLDVMCHDGLTMEQAIKKAVDLGIAEPDYQDDLSGIDTAYKLIILALMLTNVHVHPRSVSCQGVMDIHDDELKACETQGKAFRLVGTCEIKEGKPRISVGLEKVSSHDPLYWVRGTEKGITFTTTYMGKLTVVGGSSSRTHIAAALLKDIINVYKE
jgi:homoserine dehydrogenase